MNTRLYIDGIFKKGEQIILSNERSHYLLNVLRIKREKTLIIFNENIGDLISVVKNIKKNKITLEIIDQIKLPKKTQEIHLAFPPLKHLALFFLAQKCTELGVTNFWPIITKRTVNKFNSNKFSEYLLSSTQQCGRFFIPSIKKIQYLGIFLNSWFKNIPLIILVEPGTKVPSYKELELSKIKTIKKILDNQVNQIGFMIGPEGGFSEEDLNILNSFQNIYYINLNQFILRSETSAIFAISFFQLLINEKDTK